jgi:hypothetical protein
VRVFEARYGEAASAYLCTVHIKGFLSLRTAVDATTAPPPSSTALPPLPRLGRSTPDTFGSAVNPHRHRPYRQTCDVSDATLPGLLGGVVAAAEAWEATSRCTSTPSRA